MSQCTCTATEICIACLDSLQQSMNNNWYFNLPPGYLQVVPPPPNVSGIPVGLTPNPYEITGRFYGNECKHTWKFYTGLTQQYYFCETCDEKREDIKC